MKCSKKFTSYNIKQIIKENGEKVKDLSGSYMFRLKNSNNNTLINYNVMPLFYRI